MFRCMLLLMFCLPPTPPLYATLFPYPTLFRSLIGTHLISFGGYLGIVEVKAAGLLALMGIFDLIVTTGSCWLTDRYDPRKLLFIYYGLRGISLDRKSTRLNSSH